MGKHGPRAKLWPSVLGVVAAALAVTALLILVIFYRHIGPR